MAGVVTSVLTDKELDTIIHWANRGMFTEPNFSASSSEIALLEKVTAWRRSLDCDAGKCATPGYPAPDVGRKRNCEQLRGRDDV